ncbi:MaoC family dehydratase [Nocardia nova]|uniref:MaoC family dehydratase n=1 Tax=Nocardia nova TaxID=37330 RepID=UPI00371C2262
MSRVDKPIPDRAGTVYFAKTIGEFDVYSFAGITGDYYPVHIDAEYAAHHPVGERVAHGVLIMGLMSTAAGRWMVEQSIDGLSYGYDSVRFTAPVRFGDTISIAYLPENGADDGHKIYSRVEARNQRGEVVAVARHIVWRATAPGDGTEQEQQQR